MQHSEISVYLEERGDWKFFNNSRICNSSSADYSSSSSSFGADPVTLYVGGARLEWTANVDNNQTRQTLQMHPHRLTSQLKFKTRLYELNVYSVEYVDSQLDKVTPNGDADSNAKVNNGVDNSCPDDDRKLNRAGHFHFLDLEFGRLVDRSECLDGVWGRTTCQHNNYDMSMYDLNGQIFGTSLPFIV